MSDHYYTNRPDSPHDIQTFTFRLRDHEFTFKTDSGVFSRERVDFGSLLLIENMDIPRDAQVLDVGCGYGPIGIAAAHLADHGEVWMTDVNERAVQLASQNIQLNGITNARAISGDIYSAIPPQKKFHRILTNPPIRAGKKVVHRIFEEAPAFLYPKGELWVVIQKKQGAPSAFEKLQQHFSEVEEVVKKKGYRLFRAVHNKEQQI